MTGYIYRIAIAEKSYIGKTTNLHSRIKSHINHAFVHNHQRPICCALRTLKEEEVEQHFEVLAKIEGADYNVLESQLCAAENYFMDMYDSIYPNGYNVLRSYPSAKKKVVNQKPRESVMREVICVETGEHFKSMTDAAKSVGVSISSMHNCLKGNCNTSGGKHWRFADGEYHECHRQEGRKNNKTQSKPVMCKETGIVYPSCAEAQRQTGIGWTNIAKCANGKMIQAGGYKWGFVIDGKPVFKERENHNVSKIMCIETGEVFETATECAKSLGEKSAAVLLSCINYGCKHKGKTYIRLTKNGNPVLNPNIGEV